MVEARTDASNQSQERKAAWLLVETNEGGRFDPFGDSKDGVKEKRGPTSPSTGSLSSLSQSELLESPPSAGNPNMYPHVRTNLGHQSYMPPAYSASRLPAPPVTRRRAAWDDDEMPFDQMGQLQRPVHGQVKIRDSGSPARNGPTKGDRPFDEADDEILVVSPGSPKKNTSYSDQDGGGGASSIQVLRAYYSNTDRLYSSSGVYLSPPRKSSAPNKRQPLSSEHSEDTTRIHSNSHNNDDALRNEAEMVSRENLLDEAKEKYEEFGLSPGSTTDNSSPRNSRPRGGAPKVDLSEAQQGSTDEDSRFEFEADRKRKKLASVKDRRERRARRDRRIEDDCSSVEPDQGVSLQERAQQAFMTRNKKIPKITAVKEPAVPITPSRPIQKISAMSPGSVSFDKKPATVYHYVTDEEEDETVVSIDNRSINSEYTKSMESEVEDVIKDLFFIGAGLTSKPGRRSIKDQPGKKRELKMRAKKDDNLWVNDESSALETLEEESVLDETTTNFTGQTFSTLNGEDVSLDSTSTRSRSVSPAKRSEKGANPPMTGNSKQPSDDDISDPLTAMWAFMEVGVFAMSEALGIVPTQCSPTKAEVKAEPVTLARYSTDQNAAAMETMKRSSTRATPDAEKSGRFSRVRSTMECANHLLVGSNDEITDIKPEPELKRIEEEGPLTSLETDPRLAELALYTARSVHEIQGLVLDESCNVELVTQLEFHVVKIGLPLGILFQENGGGCWVANVFPHGNAAKKAQGGGVKVGDQLAAIDGRSSIKMKVDDICALISEAENTQSIELTFLRYAGPLHPVDGPFFEGYEMTDSSGNDGDDADETRTDKNTTAHEHEFDTMHKLLRASKSEEKRILKKSKRSAKKEGKKRFRLFGRKAAEI